MATATMLLVQDGRATLEDPVSKYLPDAPAAWQPITSDGPAWEIFTRIWRGEANTLAALQQQLARREHSPGSFERALHDLAARGWISGDGTTYQPSQAGRALRLRVGVADAVP